MQFSANKKLLLQILSDGLLHSEARLAKQLGLSCSAICQQANELKGQGIAITTIGNKSYRLQTKLELLEQSLIYSLLSPDVRRHLVELEIHDQINSTNCHLMALSRANPNTSAVCCLAEQQTAGKGRRGRQWVSPFGHNIYASLIWEFQSGLTSLSGLSLAIGVAVIKALKIHGIDNAGLKWPNDIYWQQRKLGGILIEMSGESHGRCYVVIGLGLNLYLTHQDATPILQDWVDIKEILGSSHQLSRNQLCATLIEQLIAVTKHYTQASFALYRDQWRQLDCMLGRQVSLLIGHTQMNGTVRGIDDDGLLLLQSKTGEIHSFASTEISFQRL